MEPQDLSLKTPFTMMVAGATNSGKTTFVVRLLASARQSFDRPIARVHFFYQTYQDAFDELRRAVSPTPVDFVQGMPTRDWMTERFGGGGRNDENGVATIVIDDQGSLLNQETADMFTVSSHHYDCNIICVVHSLFSKNPAQRLMSLNSRYLVVFKNPRDQSSVIPLARQIDPGNNQRFVDLFRKATARPFSYLFIDLAQDTDERFRLRGNVLFEDGRPMLVYERV